MRTFGVSSRPASSGAQSLRGGSRGDDTQPLPELFSFPTSFTLAGFRQAAWDYGLVIFAAVGLCSFAAAVGLIGWALFFWK